MLIIGITGTLGAGKGSVVDHLVKNWGFKHFSVREFIIEEIKKRGLPVDRDSMTFVGNELRKEHGPGFIVEEIRKKAINHRGSSIIESIRTLGEIEILKKEELGIRSYLFSVDADQSKRYERINSRKSETDNVTFEKFCSDEDREMTSDDPNKQNLSACISKADFNFYNNRTLEELIKRVDLILNIINSKAI